MLALEPPRDYAVVRCVEAWCDLTTTRGIGMAVGPIPWDKIVKWCEFHGLDHEGTKIMIQVIRKLDVDRANAAAAKANLEKARGPGAVATAGRR